MQIKASEHGVVRLFAIDLPPAEATEFDVDALGAALGGIALDAEHVDLIAPEDLDDLGLDGYLIHGIGVSKSEVVQLRPQIKALKGHVALIRSAAFGGMAPTLTPQKPLRWIASFGETPLDLTSGPLQSKSAKGVLAGGKPPAATKPVKLPWPFKFAIAVFIVAAALMLTLIGP